MPPTAATRRSPPGRRWPASTAPAGDCAAGAGRGQGARASAASPAPCRPTRGSPPRTSSTRPRPRSSSSIPTCRPGCRSGRRRSSPTSRWSSAGKRVTVPVNVAVALRGQHLQRREARRAARGAEVRGLGHARDPRSCRQRRPPARDHPRRPRHRGQPLQGRRDGGGRRCSLPQGWRADAGQPAGDVLARGRSRDRALHGDAAGAGGAGRAGQAGRLAPDHRRRGRARAARPTRRATRWSSTRTPRGATCCARPRWPCSVLDVQREAQPHRRLRDGRRRRDPGGARAARRAGRAARPRTSSPGATWAASTW